ncbi:MAG TPA: hypothetical protein DCO77_11570 [Nitrospiraceae bacterium]|nr:hypothetical protein [Nitrospiraceae bacterium]
MQQKCQLLFISFKTVVLGLTRLQTNKELPRRYTALSGQGILYIYYASMAAQETKNNAVARIIFIFSLPPSQNLNLCDAFYRQKMNYHFGIYLQSIIYMADMRILNINQCPDSREVT